MKKRPLFLIILFLAACQQTASLRYDSWIGRWTGPEGTYLDIQPNGATYKMTLANLDGPQTYYGTPVLSGIEFLRGPKMELIRAGTGEDIGMKWLADKKNCLVITYGEGYCRD